MSKDKYVQSTLTLPSELPLFNYNINFEGLRKILEGVNVKTNQNQEQIRKLQQQLGTKLPTVGLQQTEKKLNSAYLFGVKCQSYIDRVEEKSFKTHKIEVKELSDIDGFCWKMNRMAEMLEYLMGMSEKHEEKIGNDNKRNQKLIDESFRRLEDKLSSGMDSFGKTINSYFKQTNQKVSDLESQLNLLKKTTQSKIDDLNSAMIKKVSEGNLKASLDAAEVKLKKELEDSLKNDQMQRMGLTNELKNTFAQAQKDLQMKNKVAATKLQDITDKVAKALQTGVFETEKHKIYERLSEMKAKDEELSRKIFEFVQFRKTSLSNNQKIKQDIIGISDQINKMRSQEASFKKLEGMSETLNSLNPHLICEIGEEVKNHTAEIGKLQKMLLTLDNDFKNKNGVERAMPEVGNGQTSDLIQKIIKQFMSNMDFEGRLKRSEKEGYQLKKRLDAIGELQKKIYSLSKQIDMGAITKQLKRKCDEESERRDVHIIEGKIDQLFEFYKQLRREVEEKKRVAPKTDQFENATLTTKRLLSANCISCNPSTPARRRQLAKSKLQMSLDYGLQGQKNTIYSRK